jgi:hypothetical protein
LVLEVTANRQVHGPGAMRAFCFYIHRQSLFS